MHILCMHIYWEKLIAFISFSKMVHEQKFKNHFYFCHYHPKVLSQFRPLSTALTLPFLLCISFLMSSRHLSSHQHTFFIKKCFKGMGQSLTILDYSGLRNGPCCPVVFSLANHIDSL